MSFLDFDENVYFKAILLAFLIQCLNDFPFFPSFPLV